MGSDGSPDQSAMSLDSSSLAPPSPPPPEESSSPPQTPPLSSLSPSSPPPDDENFLPPPPSDSSHQSPSLSNNSIPRPPFRASTTPSPAPCYYSSDSPPFTLSPPPPVDGWSANSPPRWVGRSSSSTESSPSLSLPFYDHRTAIIVGTAAAGAFVLLMLIACLVFPRIKKRKPDGNPYRTWDNTLTPDNGSRNSSSPQETNHGAKFPPPHSPLGSTTGGGWTQPSPPPSPQMLVNISAGPSRTSLLPPSPSPAIGFSKSAAFTYEELAAATNGFAQSNMLGQGGFGCVHKGVLPNGKEVAVRCLKSGGGHPELDFLSELEIISRVRHRHLVSLVGYSIADGRRMLVHEFVPNNNLEYHLHKKGDQPLDFRTRLRIALGSAKGLAYLHEDCHPRIIHGSLKASNIQLDHQFEALVADFGLAKFATDINTNVSARVKGTFGYSAPEHAARGNITEKSDVFSYGVVLLELITGRRPADPNLSDTEDSLVDWTIPLLTKTLEDGNFDELVDSRLKGNYDPTEMVRMVGCAAACTRHFACRRLKMSQIARALEGDVPLDDLNEGGRPGKSTASSSSDGNSNDDATANRWKLNEFRQAASGSQEWGSGLYDGDTSEYGLHPSTSSDSSKELDARKNAVVQSSPVRSP
ncbi:hypothetical protein Nepgr_016556 [Nepenthes gracilis]|uniref:non-specific serine/threonine protein kinase n=1 Tax=Nepenthes gracilis TaxID=150966 RepID=A0AAD3XSL5_NEPGR|nr:hypothetical protein Nepgr_016556 [Nepenthes gracilis]